MAESSETDDIVSDFRLQNSNTIAIAMLKIPINQNSVGIVSNIIHVQMRDVNGTIGASMPKTEKDICSIAL